MDRMGRIAVVLTALVLAASPLLRAAEGDWASWQGPTRDAKSPDKGILKEWPAGGPKLLWSVEGQLGKGFSCVGIANNTVYITGDVDDKLTLFAFDMNGKLLWKAEHGAGFNDTRKFPGARSQPVIDGGNLYLESGLGLVGCFDAKTGKVKWTKDLVKDFGGKAANWGYAESPLVQGDMLIVTPGGANTLVALNKNTGEVIWKSQGVSFPAHYGSVTPFTFEGVDLLVSGTGGGIVCVEAKTGKVQWSNTFCANNVANCPTPAYADGYVFWSNGYGKGAICFKLKKDGDKIGAEQAWVSKEFVNHHGGYFIDNGCVYGNHNDGYTCFDLKTGQKKWFEKGVGKGSVLCVDGMMVLFGEKGGKVGLASFSPEGMQMKGDFSVKGEAASWAHPVVIGGRMYIRYAANLYCYDVKAK